MRGHAKGSDWVRVILMVAVSVYLGHQIYTKTKMLLKWEMGFTEEAVNSDVMKFPSITFCPGSMNNLKWPRPQAFENFTADYLNLPRLEDLLINLYGPISINE